jgi:hydroxyacylglutathione hydrolase
MRRIIQSTLPYTKCLTRSFHTVKMMRPSLSIVPTIMLPFQRNHYMFSATNHENISKSNYEGPGFYLEQLLTGCLSIYSYYVESNGEAFLIDPLNDTAKYEQILKERGAKLKGVFLTHYHADYVAGHLELSRKFGCDIYMGPKAFPTYGIKVLKDGQAIPLGSTKLQLVHTPGHTE